MEPSGQNMSKTEKINNNYSSATPINNMTNNKINKNTKLTQKAFENTQNYPPKKNAQKST